MIGRRDVALGAAAAAAAGWIGAAARPARARRAMTVSTVLGPDSPQARLWDRFQEVLDERLGPGAVRVNVLTGGVLGGEREEAEAALLGSLQGTVGTLASLGAWVPEGQAFDLPYLFRDAAHAAAVMAGPVGEDMATRYLAHGFRVLGWVDFGARQLLAKRPIAAPEGIRGVRMRVIQAPLHAELWRSLGADPTPVPITEAYGALETGVVDAMDFTESGYARAKLYEVAPFLTLTGHIRSLGALYVPEAFWRTLSEEERAAMRAAAEAAVARFDELVRADHARGLAEAEAGGAEILRPDTGPWRAAMAPFREAFAARIGAVDLLRAVEAAR